MKKSEQPASLTSKNYQHYPSSTPQSIAPGIVLRQGRRGVITSVDFYESGDYIRARGLSVNLPLEFGDLRGHWIANEVSVSDTPQEGLPKYLELCTENQVRFLAKTFAWKS